MTWKELIEQIPKDKLNTDVTIFDSCENEYFPINNFGWYKEDEDGYDIIENSFYIVF